MNRIALLITLTLFGCVSLTASPTATPLPPTTAPTVTSSADPSQWQLIAPGLELRTSIPENNTFGQLWTLRIDPANYTFRAHYSPGVGLRLAQWQEALPGAIAFVNANFFSPDLTVNGLLVADSVAYGSSYQGFGGMFQVQNGIPRVRSLSIEPYSSEPLEHAIQAFPMLVMDGGQAYSDADSATRRTVSAQDSAGRIIIMATPLLGLPLADLSEYLATSDLSLVNALNLDGGGSTMMYIGANPAWTLPSLDPVPAVLAVYPK